MPRKLLILDHNLQGYNGHYWEYDSMMSRLFLKKDFEPFIFAHKNFCADAPIKGVKILPWFSQTSADIYRPALYNKIVEKIGPLPRPVWRCLRFFYRLIKPLFSSAQPASPLPFGAECFATLEKTHAGENDIVFFQAVYEREIESFSAALLEKTKPEALPRFAIMLRRDPEEAFMKSCRAPLKKLEAFIKSGQIVLFTDTPELKESYEKALGLPVFDVPVLHDLQQILKAPQPKKESCPCFVYLGNAREEKGFHLLPALVDFLSEKHPCHFHIQAYVPEDEYVPRIMQAIEALRLKKNVTLYEEALSEADYIKLLMRGDIVLLPYKASAYQKRSSGILIQAAAAGKVLIVPENCWLSAHAPEGSSLSFAPDKLHETAARALTELSSLKKAAEKTPSSSTPFSLEAAFFSKFMAALSKGKAPCPPDESCL